MTGDFRPPDGHFWSDARGWVPMLGNIAFSPRDLLFGPNQSDLDRMRESFNLDLSKVHIQRPEDVRSCFCSGPQSGDGKLCRCRLADKQAQEATMLRDGVEIAGKRYKLVPDNG